MYDNHLALRPLAFWPSLLYFGLPALLFVVGFWGLMPWLTDLGMLPYYTYVVSVDSPLAVLLAAALLQLKLEGRAVSWEGAKARFRLGRVTRQLAALRLNPDAAGEPVVLLHGITSSIYACAVQPPCVLAQGPCYSHSMILYFRRMPEIDISPWLPRITAPTLALTGDRDPIVPPTQARHIAGLVKGAELAVIAGAGHLPFAKRATEYNAMLTQ